MKKILKAFLLTTLFVPTIVNADMSAPTTITYTGEVVKEEGIDCYDYDVNNGFKMVKQGHLDKGTKIETYYEIKVDGIKYVDTTIEECSYIKSSDIVPIGGAVKTTAEGVEKLDKPTEFMVIVDEVEVREGPSGSYKVVGTLKKGYKGTYSYYISSNIYVEEDGLKGWVNMLDKQVLTKGTDLITTYDVDTECGLIPASTIITNVWYATAWDGEALIKYNGKECYVPAFHSEMFYSFYDKAYTYTATESFKLYEKTDGKTVVAEVPKGATVKTLAKIGGVSYGAPEYVEYNGVKGWNISSNVENEPVPTEDIAPTPELVEEKKSNSLDTMTIIIICCIVAVTSALTAIVTIVLVNKKKKNVEVKEDTNEVKKED